MNNNKDITSSIIIIGNEILSGRTQDKNTSALAKWLNKKGILVKEVRIVADDINEIIYHVRDLKDKFNYVFTTGGIGPTHDDITAEAISVAFDQNYVYHKKAYQILENFYNKKNFNDGRKKMAKMPEKAKLIPNPKTFAAGFYVQNVFVLPGVPEILNAMINELDKIIPNSTEILSISCDLITKESEIADELKNIQKNFEKVVDIGSYPFFNNLNSGTSIVMRSKSQKKLLECEKIVRKSFSNLLKK